MKLPIVLLSFTLFACEGYIIPDANWYRDKGSLGARMTNTITGQGRNVPKREWDMIRFGMLCTDEESYGKYKLFIERVCARTKKCSIEDMNEALKRIEKELK